MTLELTQPRICNIKGGCGEPFFSADYFIVIISGWVGMASEFKHLVLVKFKDGVVVEDILKGMEKLVSEMDIVKSFVW